MAIGNDEMADVRKAIVNALAMAHRGDAAGTAGLLCDIVGFIKSHWRGPSVGGIHQNTRQGFIVAGTGCPVLPTEPLRIETAPARAYKEAALQEILASEATAPIPPRGHDAPALQKPVTPRRVAPGRCECGGTVAMVGDVATCGRCNTEYPAPAVGGAPAGSGYAPAPAAKPSPARQEHWRPVGSRPVRPQAPRQYPGAINLHNQPARAAAVPFDLTKPAPPVRRRRAAEGPASGPADIAEIEDEAEAG